METRRSRSAEAWLMRAPTASDTRPSVRPGRCTHGLAECSILHAPQRSMAEGSNICRVDRTDVELGHIRQWCNHRHDDGRDLDRNCETTVGVVSSGGGHEPSPSRGERGGVPRSRNSSSIALLSDALRAMTSSAGNGSGPEDQRSAVPTELRSAQPRASSLSTGLDGPTTARAERARVGSARGKLAEPSGRSLCARRRPSHRVRRRRRRYRRCP